MPAHDLLTLALGLIAIANAQNATSSATKSSGSGTSTASGAVHGSSSAASGPKPPDYSDLYAELLLAVLCGLAIVLLVYKLVLSSLRHFRHLVSLTHDKQNYFRKPHPGFAWFKEHVLYAPMFRKRHTTEIRLTRWWGIGILPTRIQSLVLIGVIAANVVACLHNIPWHMPATTLFQQLRNRFGVMATVNLIPLVLFSGRNNPLIKLLDVSFDSFNLLHRWFARIMVVEAIAHTVCWALNKEVGGGSWSAVVKLLSAPMPNVLYGMVAIVSLLIIPLQASSLFRHAFYETFLHLHQALVITALVAIWYHLAGMPEHIYIQLAVISWVIERVNRFFSLIYRNFGKTRTTATIEPLPGDAMRVTLHMPRPFQARPGQHMFLTVPAVGLWTSHPFSVAWSSEEPASNTYELKTGKAKTFADAEKGLGSSRIAVSAAPRDTALDGPTKHTVSAVIRARSGFTNSLLKKVQGSPSDRTILSALVEGPYGTQHTMASYGSVLLFAGGVGITHCLPYVRSLVAGASSHTVATRRVTLVWIIQSPEHLEWVRPWMTEVLAMEGRRDVLRVEIFITRPRSAREVRSPSSTVRMFAGRPQVAEIVGREVQGAIGALGVGVCGPGGLGDDVRRSVRGWCSVGEVDLLEESFSW